MPMYRCRLMRNGRIAGEVELEAPNDELALLEAEDGIDVMKGEWVEVVRAEESAGE